MAKKLPKPFKRPGIEIAGPDGPARRWKPIQASNIQVGDMLPGHGEVVTVKDGGGAGPMLRVGFFSGEFLFIPSTESVVAFTSFKK